MKTCLFLFLLFVLVHPVVVGPRSSNTHVHPPRNHTKPTDPPRPSVRNSIPINPVPDVEHTPTAVPKAPVPHIESAPGSKLPTPSIQTLPKNVRLETEPQHKKETLVGSTPPIVLDTLAQIPTPPVKTPDPVFVDPIDRTGSSSGTQATRQEEKDMAKMDTNAYKNVPFVWPSEPTVPMSKPVIQERTSPHVPDWDSHPHLHNVPISEEQQTIFSKHPLLTGAICVVFLVLASLWLLCLIKACLCTQHKGRWRCCILLRLFFCCPCRSLKCIGRCCIRCCEHPSTAEMSARRMQQQPDESPEGESDEEEVAEGEPGQETQPPHTIAPAATTTTARSRQPVQGTTGRLSSISDIILQPFVSTMNHGANVGRSVAARMSRREPPDPRQAALRQPPRPQHVRTQSTPMPLNTTVHPVRQSISSLRNRSRPHPTGNFFH